MRTIIARALLFLTLGVVLSACAFKMGRKYDGKNYFCAPCAEFGENGRGFGLIFFQ